MRLRHLAKDTIIYGAATAARSMVGLFLVPIYTRVFTPSDYGQLDTLITLTVLITLATTVGLDTALAVLYFDAQSCQSRGSIFVTTVAWRLLLSAFAVLVVAMFSTQLTAVLGDASSSAVNWALATVPVGVATSMLIDLLRFNRRVWAYTILSVGNLFLAVALSIWLVIGLQWGLAGAFAGSLLANLATIPLLIAWNRSYIVLQLSRQWSTKLLRIGLPLMPAALGGWLIAYFNRYVLLYFAGAGEVGLLAVGNKVSAPLALMTSAFLVAWGPFALGLQHQENARDVYAKALIYFLLISCSVALTISLFAREVILIFATPEYADGYIVSGLMAFQLVVDASYYIVAIGLLVTQKTTYLAYTVPVAATASILLNLLLVPTLGLSGAGLASLLAYAVSALLVYNLAQRMFKVPYDTGKIMRLFLLCGMMWGVGIGVTSTDWEWAFALKWAILFAYCMCLLLLRVVSWQELSFLTQQLHQRLLVYRTVNSQNR